MKNGLIVKRWIGAVVVIVAFTTLRASTCSVFRPGEIWPDDKGVHINAHGGGVLEENGVYWWYGEDKIAGKA